MEDQGRAVNPLLASLSEGRLIWLEEAGVGYFECDTTGVYDRAYFDRYAAQADTPLGQEIMSARVDLCERYGVASLLDVGIGSGAFLQEWWGVGGGGWGDDINPAGIAWLENQNKRRRLDSGLRHGAVTFWDVLEHFRDPTEALAQVGDLAFVSIPIFRDAAHVIASKHYRKDEHYWYFTRAGFIRFANRQGFRVLECNNMESLLGREDIETFVLQRVSG